MAENPSPQKSVSRELNIKRADESLGIIFVGGCGINNARLICQETNPVQHPHLQIACVNTDSAQLHRYFGSPDPKPGSHLNDWLDMRDRFVIEQLGTDGNGAGGNPEVGKSSASASMEKIAPFIERCGTLIIVGGFGGGTGTGAIPLIAKRIQEARKTVLAIVTMPFLCEGRLGIANKALEEMRNVPTIVVYNEQLQEKSLRPSQAWVQINSGCLKPMIDVLRRMILDVGMEVNTDLNDLRAVLATGNYIQFGYAQTARGESFNIDDFAKTLARNPYQDTSIIEHAEMFHLLFNGDWSIAEIERITLKVRGENRNHVDIHWGISEEGEGLWVGMIAASKIAPAADGHAPKQAEGGRHAPKRAAEQHAIRANRVIVSFTVNGKTTPLAIEKEVREQWTEAKKNEDEDTLERLCDEILVQTGQRPDNPMRSDTDPLNGDGNGTRRFPFMGGTRR